MRLSRRGWRPSRWITFHLRGAIRSRYSCGSPEHYQTALTLPDQRPGIGGSVAILQHPDGSPFLQLSLGRILNLEGDRFYYDANTSHGSSGGPVFDANWNLLGIHHWGQPHEQRRGNSGLLLANVLRELRGSKAWSEIVSYHKLADVAQPRPR